LHPDQAVAEHEGVDAVFDERRGSVSGPLQEEYVAFPQPCRSCCLLGTEHLMPAGVR